MARSSLKLLLPASLLIGAVALHLWTAPARASGDMGCTPGWRLGSSPAPGDGYGDSDTCAGRAMLVPANDSRINLLLLIRSVQSGVTRNPTYPSPSPDDGALGRSFFSWKGLRAALWPEVAPPPEPVYGQHACAAPPGAVAAFAQGLAQASSLTTTERKDLTALRATVGCPGATVTITTTSAAGRDYLAYLTVADAFYRKDYAGAGTGFAALTHASQPWVAQTAAYMAIRVAMGLAQAHAFTQYGDYDGSKVDPAAIAAAREAIAAYLHGWPTGVYAASARGLVRRVQWLASDRAALAHTYEHLLATTPADSPAAADLVEEIDTKLLLDGEKVPPLPTDTPLLLATLDLMRMRQPTADKPIALTQADLDAQAPAFAGRPDLLAYLKAARIYYTGQDAHQVLTLLPDAARRGGQAPLGFSGQMLRGMALARLGDRNEIGFWRELLTGAAPVYQRPLVELGLAQAWKKQGHPEVIFAPGSPVTDPTTREMLIQSVATPATLRLVAQDAAQPRHERDVARFTLLYKGLTRGAYGDVVRDLALVPADAGTQGGLWTFQNQKDIPVGIFTRGTWGGGFSCPALAQSAATLSHRPQDRQALLCLGDFYRLNGLDGFTLVNGRPDKDALDSGPDLFPGKPIPRSSFYAAIMDDPAATPDQRAYALYRAINCYGPSGNNACGGPDVPIAQRKAWFFTLKQRYPANRWAQSQRIYW